MRRRAMIAALAVVAAIGGAGAAGAETAGAYAYSDTFRSPSGNIRCGYVDQVGVGCYTRNNGRWAFLETRATAAPPAGRVGRDTELAIFAPVGAIAGELSPALSPAVRAKWDRRSPPT